MKSRLGSVLDVFVWPLLDVVPFRSWCYRSGLETVPHNAKIHFNYGNFLRDSGRLSEAIEHYRTAVKYVVVMVSSQYMMQETHKNGRLE